ncbi:MAG: DUF4935 domain-containing protein [Verrucomicrobia bacterium]|nr:DUF4935 domain-containing protein [Verrucomicrobiota bacterium]
MIHVFIDTNVFLDFYSTSTESLTELRRLADMAEGRVVKLWMPDQVKREFWKNRSEKIETILSAYEREKISGSVPVLIREDTEFQDIKNLLRDLEKRKALICKRVRQQILEEKTVADAVIRKLFEAAENLDTSGNVFDRAFQRAARHTPPGKNEDIGDRINWLILLENLPKPCDLHVVSLDEDFEAFKDSETISPYLAYEWRAKNGGSVALWKRISKFLSKVTFTTRPAAPAPTAATSVEVPAVDVQPPTVEAIIQDLDGSTEQVEVDPSVFTVAVNAELELAISNLAASSSFAATHRILAGFPKLDSINHSQANHLADAILTNDQVFCIAEDSDVAAFIAKVVQYCGPYLPSEILDALKALISPPPADSSS